MFLFYLSEGCSQHTTKSSVAVHVMRSLVVDEYWYFSHCKFKLLLSSTGPFQSLRCISLSLMNFMRQSDTLLQMIIRSLLKQLLMLHLEAQRKWFTSQKLQVGYAMGKGAGLAGLLDSSSYEIHGFLLARTGGQQLLDMNSYPDGFHFGIVTIHLLRCMTFQLCIGTKRKVAAFLKNMGHCACVILLCKDSFTKACIKSRTLRHNLDARLFH